MPIRENALETFGAKTEEYSDKKKRDVQNSPSSRIEYPILLEYVGSVSQPSIWRIGVIPSTRTKVRVRRKNVRKWRNLSLT